MRYQINRIITGSLLLCIGIGYLGAALHAWDFTIFVPGWWTAFLILPAICSMLHYGLKISNLFFLLLGVYLLAYTNNWINFRISWMLIGALCCIYWGCRILFRKKVTYYDYKFF